MRMRARVHHDLNRMLRQQSEKLLDRVVGVADRENFAGVGSATDFSFHQLGRPASVMNESTKELNRSVEQGSVPSQMLGEGVASKALVRGASVNPVTGVRVSRLGNRPSLVDPSPGRSGLTCILTGIPIWNFWDFVSASSTNRTVPRGSANRSSTLPESGGNPGVRGKIMLGHLPETVILCRPRRSPNVQS
jgi:hypothetical protein